MPQASAVTDQDLQGIFEVSDRVRVARVVLVGFILFSVGCFYLLKRSAIVSQSEKAKRSTDESFMQALETGLSPLDARNFNAPSSESLH